MGNNNPKMYGYICIYKGKKIEIRTDRGTYAAQQLAAKEFGAKKSYEVDVYLAEIDGKPYEHTATF